MNAAQNPNKAEMTEIQHLLETIVREQMTAGCGVSVILCCYFVTWTEAMSTFCRGKWQDVLGESAGIHNHN